MSHLSGLLLTGLLAEDLPPAEREKAEAHLASCPDCARRFSEARGQASAFAGKYPSREYLAATRRARSSPVRSAPNLWTRLWGSLWAAGGARAAFAGLLVLASALGVMRLVSEAPPLPNLSSKGGQAGPALAEARFHLFRNGVSVPGDTLGAAPGDTLQLGIVSARPVHFAVYYRDDQGALAAYFPPDPDRPPAGSPRGANLPNSLVLDSGWQVEVLSCLWAHRPFTAAEAGQAAASGKGGDGTAAPALQTFTLRNSRL